MLSPSFMASEEEEQAGEFTRRTFQSFLFPLFQEFLLHIILNFLPIWQHSKDEDSVEEEDGCRVELGEGKES